MDGDPAKVRLFSQKSGLRMTGHVLDQEGPTRKMLARINKLIEDIRRDPFTGIGKPEPLKYHLPGAWSRRIDEEHRLVYVVTDKEIIIHCGPLPLLSGTSEFMAQAKTTE